MRVFLFALGIFVGATGLHTPAAAEISYPWCADYGGAMAGSSNCGFTTQAQCMASISGNGGFCNPNTQYQPAGPAGRPAQRPPRRYQ
jgi:hypothetical protein